MTIDDMRGDDDRREEQGDEEDGRKEGIGDNDDVTTTIEIEWRRTL